MGAFFVKAKKRTTDLSGTGAYNAGGRWNSSGVYALYTSENRSLASLEVLVHVDEGELPPDLYVMTIEIVDSALTCGFLSNYQTLSGQAADKTC